jgi:HSP20 family protein
MNMVRWDPFRELETFSSRLNRFFNQAAPGTSDDAAAFADWSPAIDFEESDREYLVKADVPDVQKDDIKVNVEDGVLSVEGERRQTKEETTKKFHRIERAYGSFVRRLVLPSDVDQQNVSAELTNGVLRIRLPKSDSAKPRSVQVKVA